MYDENLFISKNKQLEILIKLQHECEESNSTVNVEADELHCPVIWDGILCWPKTSAGTVTSLPCPSYFLGFNTLENATKECTQNGTWFFNAHENQIWTNYSNCATNPIVTVLQPPDSNIPSSKAIQFLPILKAISQTGYGVSLFTLIIAFIILASLKRLRCPRNILHMHLFVSFMLRASLSLLKDTLITKGIGLSSHLESQDGDQIFTGNLKDSWNCKLLITLWQFSFIANYVWILMEGLYLHNLIFLALFSDNSSITLYVILGWCLPLAFVIPWTVLRVLYEDMFCWTLNNNPFFFHLIRVPILVSILVNFFLFLNIVRVLHLKLSASIPEERRRFRYRKWAKSTLVLIPLFGAHYALLIWMSYSVGNNETLEVVWLFCDQLFASFQGFFVAVLYCFLNGEVRAELMKKHNFSSRDHYSNTDRPRSLVKMDKNHKKGSSTTESCVISFMSSAPNDINSRRCSLQKMMTTQLGAEVKPSPLSTLINKETPT